MNINIPQIFFADKQRILAINLDWIRSVWGKTPIWWETLERSEDFKSKAFEALQVRVRSLL